MLEHSQALMRPSPIAPMRRFALARSATLIMAGQPGDIADPQEFDDETKWSQAKWAASPTTDDGACYIISEDEAPDPNKQWFFCSDPAEDDSMTCELVPEWSAPL